MEKKEIWACTYSFPLTSQQNGITGKNSSIDAVLVKYLVKSIYEKKSLASASTVLQMCQIQKKGLVALEIYAGQLLALYRG